MLARNNEGLKRGGGGWRFGFCVKWLGVRHGKWAARGGCVECGKEKKKEGEGKWIVGVGGWGLGWVRRGDGIFG